MRRIILLLSVTLLATFSAAATADQTSDIAAYLDNVEACNQRMGVIAIRVKTEMASLEQLIESGDFDPVAINAQIQGYVTSMRAQETLVKAIQAPQVARAHQEATLAQYNVAMRSISETMPMIDIAGEMAKLGRAVEESKDSAEQNALIAQMEALQNKLQAIQDEVDKVTEDGQKFGVTEKSEKAKLLKLSGRG